MKTTTKMMAFAAVLLAATAAKAAGDSYIYWMVDSQVKDYWTHDVITWDQAKVKALSSNGSDSDKYLTWWYSDGTAVTADSGLEAIGPQTDGSSADLYWGAFDSGEYTSFLFELYYGGDLVAYSSAYQWISPDSIVSGTNASGAEVMRLSTVVPEPTSGLLSLFGLAALALRRRRRA